MTRSITLLPINTITMYEHERYGDFCQALLIFNDTSLTINIHEIDETAESFCERPKRLPNDKSAICRLYATGEASCVSITKTATESEEKELLRLLEDCYDQIFPDIAKEVKAFEDDLVQTTLAARKVNPQRVLANPDGVMTFTLQDSLLNLFLSLGRAQIRKLDAGNHFVGLFVDLAKVHSGQETLGMVPFEAFAKYRQGRAISAAAKRVNACAVIQMFTAYILDDDGKRTGKEILQVMCVNPDGTAAVANQGYSLTADGFLWEEVEEMPKTPQRMVPAWGVPVMAN